MSDTPAVALVTGPGGAPGDDPLVAALEAAGARVGHLTWDAEQDPATALRAADAASYGVLVLRPTLGEAGHLADLLAWAAAAERVTTLVNPADVLRWAAHRGHLTELAARGVAVLPTRVVPAASPDVLDQLGECPWEEVVVSSAVATGDPDEGADEETGGVGSPPGALTGRRDDPAVLEHLALLATTGDVIVQPRASAPRSLVLVGGAVVGPHGRDDDTADRSADLRAALAALQVAPARVDLVRVRLVDHDGVGVVSAVEAVAPDLGDDPQVTAAVADHLVALARG